MSFTWNGLTVNDIFPIEAMYTLSESTYVNSTASIISGLEQDIKNKLAHEISQRIMQSIEIHKQTDPYNANTTYHARAYMANVKHSKLSTTTPFPGLSPTSGVLSTTSSWNGTSVTMPVTHTTGSSVYTSTVDYQAEYEKFRVCEYTKNGKVTRVELQYNVDGFWEKIQRVQIEE